jgi:hypothetical protein
MPSTDPLWQSQSQRYRLLRRVGTHTKWETVHGPTGDVWDMLSALTANYNTDAKYDHRFVQYRIAHESEEIS